MADLFGSPKILVASARDQIVEFRTKSKAFLDAEPYTRIVEPDPNSTHNLYKIRVNQPIPDPVVVSAYRIATDLRAALDQAAYATALAAGVKKPRSAYFPFCREADFFEDQLGKNCRDVPSEIRNFFRHLKPYKGGDDLLWALNEMANGNKHRTLVPLATFAGEAGIEKLSFRGGEFCLFTPAWDRGKNEIVIFSASKDFQLEHFKVKILASVAFDEIEIIRNKPAIGILDELVGKVDGIVGAMEAELRRIRLIS